MGIRQRGRRQLYALNRCFEGTVGRVGKVEMDENIAAFLRVLDPDDNATGGGTASAVVGAMAAGLVGMVARLSVGKKNMPEPNSFYQEIDEEAQELSTELFAGGHRDSKAFDKVMRAFRLSKFTDQEKVARSQAIQDSILNATRVPLANAENCALTLDLAATLEGRSNLNAASDLECAQYLAQAGLKGALSNVQINLTSIKDEVVAGELAEKARVLSKRIG